MDNFVAMANAIIRRQLNLPISSVIQPVQPIIKPTQVTTPLISPEINLKVKKQEIKMDKQYDYNNIEKDANGMLLCPKCKKPCTNIHGLNIHASRMHKIRLNIYNAPVISNWKPIEKPAEEIVEKPVNLVQLTESELHKQSSIIDQPKDDISLDETIAKPVIDIEKEQSKSINIPIMLDKVISRYGPVNEISSFYSHLQSIITILKPGPIS